MRFNKTTNDNKLVLPLTQEKNIKTLLMSLVLCVFIVTSFKAASNESLNDIKEKHQLTTVGEARFSVFFWDIYDSKLYTKTGSYSTKTPPNDIILFEITYLRDIRKNDLIEKTIEQWQHLNINKSIYQPYLPELSTIWPDIKKGDSLALYIHHNQSQFFFNGNAIGAIEDPSFHQNFIDIWLSPKTSQPKLREKLIGITQ